MGSLQQNHHYFLHINPECHRDIAPNHPLHLAWFTQVSAAKHSSAHLPGTIYSATSRGCLLPLHSYFNIADIENKSRKEDVPGKLLYASVVPRKWGNVSVFISHALQCVEQL